MKIYLEKKPFICIRLETYFTFTKCQLKEAHNVLLHLARYRPSNFGISTDILMHIIQHVCHSPIAEQKYLQEALWDVRFQEVMNDYGMFFLHDLDLDCHCIHEIPTKDPYYCKITMSFKGKVPTNSGPNSQLSTFRSLPTWGHTSLARGQSLYWMGSHCVHE